MARSRTTSATTSGSKSSVSTMTVSQALAAFVATPNMAAVTIADSSANIRNGLDALDLLAKAGRIKSIVLTDTSALSISYGQLLDDATVIALLPTGVNLAVTALTVAQAAGVQANAKVKSFTVVDSTAAVSAGLDTLNADGKLTAVMLTDGTVLPVTYIQYVNDRSVLGKLAKGTTYAVADVPAAKASRLQSSSTVAAFSVTDTVANTIAYTTALNAASKLSGVTVSGTAAAVAAKLGPLSAVKALASMALTDGSVLSVDFAAYRTYAPTLDKLVAGDTLAVSDVPVASLSAVAGDPQVSTLTVADTLATIGGSLDALAALATAGRLTRIVVTDNGQTLTLSPEQYAADQDAIALLSGDFTIVQSGGTATEPVPQPDIPPPPTADKAPVINLVWDSSALAAPTEFRLAMEYVAGLFNQLISSPITVNVAVGWGEVRGTALGQGLIGEAYVDTGVFVTFSQYKAALTAHSTSATIQTALDAMTDPGDWRQIFVAGSSAKALGLMAPDATAVDASIGFAADTTGAMYSYDAANRAVAGKYDFIGLAEHELSHALGRVSYSWATTGFDLYRYAAPGVRATANGSAAYASIDGGVTSLGAFSTTGDAADWSLSVGADVSNAFLSTGIGYSFSAADAALLNALGYAYATDGTVTPDTVSAYLNGTASSPGFIPQGSGAAFLPTDTAVWSDAGETTVNDFLPERERPAGDRWLADTSPAYGGGLPSDPSHDGIAAPAWFHTGQ